LSATTVVLIAVAAVLAGITLGWGGRVAATRAILAARAAERRFIKEFTTLVDGTELDVAALRGPGHGSPAAAAVSAATAFAEPTSDAALLVPKALSLEDQDYYAASWRNVRGEFASAPVSGLMLAAHLTANLLLNRGLLPADTARPTVLPASWTFPTARGYRDALRISARTESREGAPVGEAELSRALDLFEEFYWEMLTLSTVEQWPS